MFGEVFITPAIDMLLFVIIAYSLVYPIYIIVYKKDVRSMMAVDLKISIVMLLLIIGYYYGSGIRIPFVGFGIHWLVYYLVISGIIEFAYFFIYKQVVKIGWKEIFLENSK